MSSYTRNALENWLKTIYLPPGLRILDVGGSQNPVKGRLGSAGEGSEYKILDLETPHECKQKPDLEKDLNESINDFDLGRFGIGNSNFDIAFCLEVSEYWWNPATALKNINRLLKKDGLLYISFHFIYPVHNPEGQDFLRYTKWGIQKLMKESGFEIEEIKPRKEEKIYDLDKEQDSEHLYDWYVSQKMRPCLKFEGHEDVGYLVKARKL